MSKKTTIEWQKAHWEQVKKHKLVWYHKNQEKQNEKQKIYYKEIWLKRPGNREKHNAYTRMYYLRKKLNQI